MCGCKNYEPYYTTSFGGSDDKEGHIIRNVQVVKCKQCGFIYSSEVLTKESANSFWNLYSNKVHQCDPKANEYRSIMYTLEYDYISKFFTKNSPKTVLDVGCANGGFLEHFYDDGWECYGVEIDEENGELINENVKVYFEEFPNIDFKDKYFDLIIFRGTIIYFDNPQLYFEKAIERLNPEGYIYITSTPNPESFCYEIFKGQSKIPVCGIAQNGFTKTYLIKYFNEKGFLLSGDRCFYEETPYANILEDIEMVYKAIDYQKKGKKIDFQSPPFWGNMMTLVFRKDSIL